MKLCSLFILSFVILICSCESKSYESKTYRRVDYTDFGGVDLITYQVPGDKPHQYIRFGYAGAHYPECKYCKENKDTINGD